MSKLTYLIISDMHCGSCVNTIEQALKQLPEVENASVNFAERTAMVQGNVDAGHLIKTIKNAGYTATLQTTETGNDDISQIKHFQQLRNQTIVAWIIGAPLLAAMFFNFIPMLNTTHGFIINAAIGIITLFALIYSGGSIYRGAWKSLLVLTANMDTLIAIGTAAAWLYSMAMVLFSHFFPTIAHHLYFESAIIIIAFIKLGALLEARARNQTSQVIKRLLDLQPETARVIREDKEIDLPVREVLLNDLIRIHPGEKIPVDGEIIEGHSAINESMLSGEPLAVKKSLGDKVNAGTLNTSGSFIFKTTAVGEHTALAQIISLVRQAQSTKPAIGRLVDKIAAYFVPAVLLIAIITALIWFNVGPAPQSIYMLISAMTVLIIACPCALGLATPIAIMIGVGKAAEYGILIRNGDALQQASQLTVIILDKTGTITEGTPRVNKIITAANISEEQLLAVAASVEIHSEHPLAQAIVSSAEKRSIELHTAEMFQAIEGFGVRAKINNQGVVIGKALFMEKNKIDFSAFADPIKVATAQTESIIYIAVDRKPAGLIVVADKIKDDSANAIKRLFRAGLTVYMLTGDNKNTAQAVAEQLGIKHIFAEVLPHEKLKYIAQLQQQKHIVAMVGDGINDAPALAKADVGFAIGAGTDVAIESADITLLRSSLHGVADAIQISKATMRNIKQNLFGAMIYNIVGIPIAAGILYPFTHMLLNPMIAGAAMAASSLTVVLNANRLRFFKIRK